MLYCEPFLISPPGVFNQKFISQRLILAFEVALNKLKYGGQPGECFSLLGKRTSEILLHGKLSALPMVLEALEFTEETSL